MVVWEYPESITNRASAGLRVDAGARGESPSKRAGMSLYAFNEGPVFVLVEWRDKWKE